MQLYHAPLYSINLYHDCAIKQLSVYLLMSKQSEIQISSSFTQIVDTVKKQSFHHSTLDKLRMKLKQCFDKNNKYQQLSNENKFRKLEQIKQKTESEVQQMQTQFFQKKQITENQKLQHFKYLKEQSSIKSPQKQAKIKNSRRKKNLRKKQQNLNQNRQDQNLQQKSCNSSPAYKPYHFSLQKMGMLIKIFQLHKQTQAEKKIFANNHQKQQKRCNFRRLSMRKVSIFTAIPKRQVISLYRRYIKNSQGVVQLFQKAIENRFELDNDQILELQKKARESFQFVQRDKYKNVLQNNKKDVQQCEKDPIQLQKQLKMLKSQLRNFQNLKISVNKKHLNVYQQPIEQFDKHQLFMKRKQAISQVLQNNPLMPSFQIAKLLSKRPQLLVPGMNHLPNNTVKRTIDIIKRQRNKNAITQNTPLNLEMNHPKRINGTLCCFFNSPNIIQKRYQYAKLYRKLRSLHIPTYFMAQQRFVYYPPKDYQQLRKQNQIGIQNFHMLKQIIFKVKKDFQKLNPKQKIIFDNFLSIKKDPPNAPLNMIEKRKNYNILDLITQNKHEMAMYCMRENMMDLQLQLFRESTQKKHPLWQSIIQLTKPIQEQKKIVYLIAVMSLEGGIQAWQMSTKPYNRQTHLNFFDKVLKLLSKKPAVQNNFQPQQQSNRDESNSNVLKKQSKMRFLPKRDEDQYDGYLFFYNKRLHDLTLQMLKKQHKGNIQLYCLPGKLSIFNPGCLWMRDLMARVYKLWERQMMQVPQQPKKQAKIPNQQIQMVDERYQQQNKESGNQTTQQRKIQQMLDNPKNVREFMLIIKKYIAQGKYDFQEYFEGIQSTIEKCLVKKQLSMSDIPINQR